MIALPIDPFLPAIADSFTRHPNLVLTAEPGAGKTTRVPPFLLAERGNQEIVVLEPRRLAARLSAARVAEELGERPGERVGYQIRFEELVGPRTQLRYVTEGVLLRQLLADPVLRSVGLVVLDEFHERSLQADLALALLRRLQLEDRPDLKLLVMSATLETDPIASYLGGCPTIRAPGRQFPVNITYVSSPSDRPLEHRVAVAVQSVLNEEDAGDLLVFLPGVAEIRRAAASCESTASAQGIELLPLHGSLSPAAQDRAVRPSAYRKLVLSTNVAETSLTIDGVTAVIDSGLARVAGHSPWSGLPSLKVAKISKAAAAQRAGRAGRTQSGRCLRLYGKADHDARPAQELPEIQRADLSEAVLWLRASGVQKVEDFGWFEPPLSEAVAAADELLHRLGAIEAGEGLSELGRRMARLPLHPRLSRLLIEAERQQRAKAGAALAALLGERELLVDRGEHGTRVGDSDPLEQLALYRQATAARLTEERLERLGIDPGRARAVARAERQLLSLCRGAEEAPADEEQESEDLRMALLMAYPDRVARRRKPGSDELLLSGGGTALLSRQSVVRHADLMVAIEAEEQRRAGQSALGVIRSASAIEPEWLLDRFPERLREEQQIRFKTETGRVESRGRILYDALVLEDFQSKGDPEHLAAALAEAAMERGAGSFASEGALEILLARLVFAAERHPEVPFPKWDQSSIEAALRRLAQGKRTFAEMEEQPLTEVLLAELLPEQRMQLEAIAPDSVLLRGKRRVTVQYAAGQPPWIESRLQDFFGLRSGPTIDGGRQPLTLHLLAPNRRAVQVTNDLAGFWERTYPTVRRELRRRYPKHAWPEDPTK